MEVIPYLSQPPRKDGSFLDRNPNLSYLLVFGESAVQVDAGYNSVQAVRELKQRQISLDYVLITHNHSDHTYNMTEMVTNYHEAKIGIHPYSVDALRRQGFEHVFPLDDGMVLNLGNGALSVVHTPGHTADSVSFWEEKDNIFFSGDTLFGGGIGCSDYDNGGNRNVFFQTIVNLIKILPSEIKIYPGHYSEHHRTMPPYLFFGETVKNPYVVNAKSGNREKFDWDLKEFSVEFERNDCVMLTEADIDRAMALEREIWVPELQAKREIILNRLRLGHRLLAVQNRGKAVGMIGWRYASFSILDSPDDFPRKFANFANDPSCDKATAKSAFIYSVGVKPTARRQGAGSYMLQQAFEKMREFGIDQVFVDSRLPSYNGSAQPPYEVIPENPEFKEALIRYFTRHKFPTMAELSLDPDIRFYMKNGFKPWSILKDFIQDQHSGNIRIICYLNLKQEDYGYRLGG